MRARVYLSLAGHGLHRGFEAAFVLFTAAAVTALCFAGAILAAVRSEEAAPCELSVTAPGWTSVTAQTVQDFRAIANVVDATGVVEVPVTVQSGKYAAGLTLVGIDGAYLSDLTYTGGALFPASSAMPWLVLSKGAAQSFADPDDKTNHGADYMPELDWLSADFSLTVGDSAVAARVSGLFEGDEPAAYVGLDAAKALLQSQGQPAGYTGAQVRAANAGAAEAVSRAVTDLGFTVENRDSARQEQWDSQTREAIYLAVLAAAGLLCADMTGLAGTALGQEDARRRTDALRWAGIGEAVIQGANALRAAGLALAGAVLGTALHYLTAALAGLDKSTASGFALTLPAPWLLLPACAAVLSGLISRLVSAALLRR